MAIADSHHPSIISMVGMGELDEDALETLYCWVDEIPLSRRKKNMTRDFSDGVALLGLIANNSELKARNKMSPDRIMGLSSYLLQFAVAELVKFFRPRIVELHNYVTGSSVENKMTNWHMLNSITSYHADFFTELTLTKWLKPWSILWRLNISFNAHCIVMVAEVIKYYLPKLVELHHYTPASNTRQKQHNWFHLNRKVFQRLDLEISPDVIRAIAQCKPWVVEHVLLVLREKINLGLARTHVQNQPVGTGLKHTINRSDQPEVDQNTQKGYGHATYNLQQHRNTKNLQNKKDLSPRAHQPNQRLIQGPPDYSRHPEVVPKKMVLDKETTIRARQVTIELLEAKVQRLENLLHLKDIRIEDLTTRVENLESKLNTSPPRKPAATRTKRASFGHSKS